MWGKPFEALCMPGRWVVGGGGGGGGLHWVQMCVSSVVELVLALSLCIMVVIDGGAIVQVSLWMVKALERDWTLLLHPNVNVVQWIIRQERCGDFDAACVSSEPVWCAFVYTVFCFEKKWGCSCKNRRLYVSSGSPPYRSWIPLWAGISALCLTGQSSHRGINVSIVNLALQLLNAGGISKKWGLNLQCFLFLGWLTKQWGYKMLSSLSILGSVLQWWNPFASSTLTKCVPIFLL